MAAVKKQQAQRSNRFFSGLPRRQKSQKEKEKEKEKYPRHTTGLVLPAPQPIRPSSDHSGSTTATANPAAGTTKPAPIGLSSAKSVSTTFQAPFHYAAAKSPPPGEPLARSAFSCKKPHPSLRVEVDDDNDKLSPPAPTHVPSPPRSTPQIDGDPVGDLHDNMMQCDHPLVSRRYNNPNNAYHHQHHHHHYVQQMADYKPPLFSRVNSSRSMASVSTYGSVGRGGRGLHRDFSRASSIASRASFASNISAASSAMSELSFIHKKAQQQGATERSDYSRPIIFGDSAAPNNNTTSRPSYQPTSSMFPEHLRNQFRMKEQGKTTSLLLRGVEPRPAIMMQGPSRPVNPHARTVAKASTSPATYY
jgi:hypothetical protein